MKTLYIGGQSYKKSSGSMWKIYMFLILFFVVIGSTLKITAPILVEKWINEKGSDANGYAFSVRAVDLYLEKGEIVLKDVKVFNPETHTKLLETPSLAIHINLRDFFLGQDKNVSVVAEKVDLILSKDFSSEMKRIKAAGEKQTADLYLNMIDGKIAKLNIIEQKEDLSRTVIELSDVNVKVKDISPLSINKKTEFSITSKIADGGKLNLTGKTREVEGRTPWTIQGSLKQVPAGIFNRISGDKLPFSFNESRLNAEITAFSDQGVVSGEIAPEIKKLNLLVERPGVPSRSIARALTDELTFTLPFVLKDELKIHYAETYEKLKTYRKYPTSAQVTLAD